MVRKVRRCWYPKELKRFTQDPPGRRRYLTLRPATGRNGIVLDTMPLYQVRENSVNGTMLLLLRNVLRSAASYQKRGMVRWSRPLYVRKTRACGINL